MIYTKDNIISLTWHFPNECVYYKNRMIDRDRIRATSYKKDTHEVSREHWDFLLSFYLEMMNANAWQEYSLENEKIIETYPMY